jgi:hypothetical protein
MTKKTKDRPYQADKEKAPRPAFLFPLRLPLVRSDADPVFHRLCRSIARSSIRCPESTVENDTVIGNFGGPAPQGGVSPADDLVATLPANLRVSFILQQMENEVVSGNGVGTPCWARWETHSSVATEEKGEGGPFTLPAPGPGEIWPVPHANGIYDALVQDGCGSTPVLPVTFHSSVGEMEDILSPYVLIGQFDAVDNTTLQPNGFWTFSYTIRATGTQGGVSDFKFRGIVSVTCTNIQTFLR